MKLSDSEMLILQLIWEENGELMFSEIVDKLHKKDYTWKNNTILTFLARLVKKNVLKVEKVGRRNRYIALITEEEFLKNTTEDFIGKVYEGQVKGLIATLLENDIVSPEEIDEIKEYWEKHHGG